MSKQCFLTTTDNPFDPFEQFDEWFRFDVEKGYYSCSRLERIAQRREDETQRESDAETERAIDEIIKYDVTNLYKKVTKETKDYPDDDDVEVEED